MKKHEATNLRQLLSKAKGYDAVKEIVGEWTGENEMKQIVDAIEKNPPRLRRMYLPAPSSPTTANDTTSKPVSANRNGVMVSAVLSALSPTEDETYTTPQNTQNPEPPSSGAPFLPKEFHSTNPLPPRPDPATPTPTVSA
jgi:tRNA-dihydrouridine synthase 2